MRVPGKTGTYRFLVRAADTCSAVVKPMSLVVTRANLLSLQQTSDLLDNLLAWARSQIRESALVANEISLNRLTDQTIRFLERMADAKNIRLINEVPVECSAYADEGSIKIVLRNLIMNAIKFTGSGGVVRVKSNVTGAYVKVMVEDNGIGIPAEYFQSTQFPEFPRHPRSSRCTELRADRPPAKRDSAFLRK